MVDQQSSCFISIEEPVAPLPVRDRQSNPVCIWVRAHHQGRIAFLGQIHGLCQCRSLFWIGAFHGGKGTVWHRLRCHLMDVPESKSVQSSRDGKCARAVQTCECNRQIRAMLHQIL